MHKSFAAAGPRIKLWINQKKWMILAALLLTFSAFAAFVVLRWPFSQQRIVRSLQETFLATVTFPELSSDLFPSSGLCCRGSLFPAAR